LLLTIIVACAGFQIVENLVDGLPAKNVNIKKMIRVAKSMVLGKVGREGTEILTIARFDPLESYIEEKNRFVGQLC
jgi:hypothetical protein